MKHFVFDVDVIVDALLEKDLAAQRLFTNINQGDALGWVAVSALPTVAAELRQALQAAGTHTNEVNATVTRLLVQLSQQLKPLSVPGAECMACITTARDLANAQIVLAAQALGDQPIIVSANPEFDTLDKAIVMQPQAYLDADSAAIATGNTTSLDFINLKEQQRQLLPGIEQRLRTV